LESESLWFSSKDIDSYQCAGTVTKTISFVAYPKEKFNIAGTFVKKRLLHTGRDKYETQSQLFIPKGY
jgi:hypothetical protein